MNDWLTTALDLIDQDEAAVLITVIGTRGSAPRDGGTRMIVGADHSHGTIGGGHLEYKAIGLAREQMRQHGFPDVNASLRRFPLGASLGQCCGGLVHLLFEPLNREAAHWMQYLRTHHEADQPVMMITQAVADNRETGRIATIRKLLVSEIDCHGELHGIQQTALHTARKLLHGNSPIPGNSDRSLWFERLVPDDFRITIFGAGHVGKALVSVLGALPCRINWIDSREAEFPTTVPANVQIIIAEEPELEVASIKAGSHVLILTHNHALDELICAQALQNDSLAWCGLIGSASKRRKFVQRFQARGMSDDAIARLTCPIGLPDLGGKHPGEIAVSVAAQILAIRQQELASRTELPHATTQYDFA